MNTTSKGDSKEKLAIKLVSDMGYTAEDAKRKVVWIFRNGKRVPIMQRNDYFGMFDIHGFNHERHYYVQVTHYGSQSPRMNKIKDFIAENPMPSSTRIDCWAWRGGRRRLDKRYKEKVWLPAQVFYVYRFENGEWSLLHMMDKEGNVPDDMVDDGDE